MSIVLRLDKEALLSLLEDSSDEFKLELTTAVCAEAARAVGMKAQAICKQYVDERYKREIQKIVKEEFANIDWAGRTTGLKSDFTSKIQWEVEKAVSSTVREAIVNASTDKMVDEVVRLLTDHVAYLVRERVNKLMSDTVSKSILEAISGGVPQG